MNRSWSPRALLAGMGFFAALGATSCGHCPEHQNGGSPPVAPDPEGDKKRVVEQLTSSGELAPDLKPIVNGTADTLFEQTFGKPSPAMERPTATVCFQRGCLYQVIYRDRCALAAFSRQLYGPAGTALRRWPGSVFRSAPTTLKDGRVEVTWALLIDDASGKRQRLLEAAKATDLPPPVFPDRCPAGDTMTPPPATKSTAPSEVK